MTYSVKKSLFNSQVLGSALCAALLFGIGSQSAIAANYDFPHLETVGISQVQVAPDMAEISVQVSLTKSTAKEAKSAVDEAVVKFIARLKEAGVSTDDIQSANLQIQPQYHYPSKQPRELTGYHASRQLTVTVMKLNQLNDILDSALEEGINRVQNIALKSSDETKAIEQARQAAINDAKQKAQSLAQGFDRKLDGVWEIRYLTQHPVQPVMMRMSAVQSDTMESYQYGEVNVEERVEVVYRLK
ncbi:oxidative stress defense protein [Shewanella sp. MMG014]|uniref:oxidative stress defense protein n=1 Tax=Shewanella sp. MMG014 TaxID=2822691 RepID=UPI001B35A78B|nr:oxidative stress defense protein [Shewanella sp. MMG014]MBQ4891508.1 oxidative stress defense protein [Shewanella sp. MMG014]